MLAKPLPFPLPLQVSSISKFLFKSCRLYKDGEFQLQKGEKLPEPIRTVCIDILKSLLDRHNTKKAREILERQRLGHKKVWLLDKLPPIEMPQLGKVD